MKSDLTVKGTESLIKRFEKLAAAGDDSAGQKIVKRGADELRDKMKARAPEKTGRLKRAINSKNMPPSAVPVAIVAVDQSRRGAPHAHLIEFGTVKAPAYPFFRPTIDEDGPRVASEMRGEVRQAIKKAAR